MPRFEETDNEIRIYFEDIPSEEIRVRMKALHYRWQSDGRYWHTRVSEPAMILAEALCGRTAVGSDMPPHEPAYGSGMPTEERSGLTDVSDVLKRYRHICWYPSAGSDFREVLFLSEQYYKWKDVPKDSGQVLPDLFLLTDVYPNPDTFTGGYGIDPNVNGYTHIYKLTNRTIKPGDYLFSGTRLLTDIRIDSLERLKNVSPDINEAVCNMRRESYTGTAYLFHVTVTSGLLGTWKTDVLYAVTENVAFAKDVLLAEHIPVEYVIQIRYGNGFGGSRISGDWLSLLLKSLGCRYFIANDQYCRIYDPDDLLVEKVIKEIFNNGELQAPDYELIYNIDGVQWSNYGPVLWTRIK